MANSESDHDFCGYVTPADKVREGASNVMKLVIASMAIVLVWAVTTALAAYYAVTSTNGSYSQELVINLLASLLLVALVPFVIQVSATSRRMFWAFAAATAGVLIGAYLAESGLRDVLLNFGSGLCLLLGVDDYVSRRFNAWTKRMADRAELMNEAPISG